MMAEDLKSQVRSFWEANPCGAKFAAADIGSPEFFDAVEKHRYSTESHIPSVVGFQNWKGKSVLEVGCGLGTDAISFARAGANYTGVDLTNRSIELVKRRFDLQGFDGDLRVADAEQLPFADNTFDLLYSHGVLHHTPRIGAAIAEAHRVLRPGGTAMIMLYHKRSYNYYVNIMLLRRLGLRLLGFNWGPSFVHAVTGEDRERLLEFQRTYRSDPKTLLDKDVFLNNNTDGVGNPLARVFTRREGRDLLRQFSEVRTEVHFLNKRWIPLIGPLLPPRVEHALAHRAGWHLWLHAKK